MSNIPQTGTRVRLKTDPGRVGIVTGETRTRQGLLHLQVVFLDGYTTFVPTDQLLVSAAESSDPLTAFESGRLGGILELRKLITHIRLTGRLANVLYSMDTTETDFYAYQFKPVLKLLNSPSFGILIADEVGLGKTIEAGLIWTELRAREDFRRLLVLCPAMLRQKWVDELRRRFGVTAEVGNAASVLHHLRAAAGETPLSSFALVASLQGVRPPRDWEDDSVSSPAAALARLLHTHEGQSTLIDLLVIDEAHYLRNPETRTAESARLFRAVSLYVALLSATPIHLHSSNLFELLRYVDPDTFTRADIFDDILIANSPLVRARDAVLSRRFSRAELEACLTEASTHPLLRDNQQLRFLLASLPSDEALLHDKRVATRVAHRIEGLNLFAHVVSRTRKREVHEWRVIREPHAWAVRMTAPERHFYQAVTEAVRDYCSKAAAYEGFLLVMPQRQMSSSMPAALRTWQERLATPSHSNFLQEAYEDFGLDGVAGKRHRPLVDALTARALSFGTYSELYVNDSKYLTLLDVLRLYFGTVPDVKIVLFSYFRPTLHYLDERLHSDGIATFLLLGGYPDKDHVLSTFRDHPGGSVLLSSEVGSEGIDLQFSWIVINYDLPWNPMKVEQRIGRVDRLGQLSPKVEIHNLFYDDTIDARIYNRLYDRLRLFEHTLGSIEPVLGERIQSLSLDLLGNKLTPAQETERIDQAALAIENQRHEEEALEEQAAALVAFGDYIVNEVNAARELRRTITDEDIRAYTTDFLLTRYPGCQCRPLDATRDGKTWELRLSPEMIADLETFAKQARLQLSPAIRRSNSTPLRCRFANSALLSSDKGAERIGQFHPLVRFAGHRLKEEEDAFYRAVAVCIDRARLSLSCPVGYYAFSVQRWSVGGVQDRERLAFAVGSLSSPKTLLEDETAEVLVVMAATDGEDWLGAANAIDLRQAARVINESCIAHCDEQYAKYIEALQAQNSDRVTFQLLSLESHLTRQLEVLQSVRDRHASQGRTALVRATEGRMRALQGRVAQRRAAIEARRTLRHSKDDICVGVIRVTQ
jgi:superfamily II DNA or RNA helicase